jgi:hypothetical protein
VTEEWSGVGPEHSAAGDQTEPVLWDVAPTWSAPDPTGVPAVDEAVAELSALELLPTSEHVAVFDVVHRKLQDALADLDGA